MKLIKSRSEQRTEHHTFGTCRPEELWPTGRLADWPLRSEAEEKDKGRAFMKVNVAEITRRWMDRGYFLKDRRTLSVQKTAT
ncbi:MAG: hypothetical protein H6592_04530 [Flavobacteriales bacterium]|nr:hypothetical protein [Flavobacteriales bacterium]HPF90128.1 hypothetical protein [Flavobacteriales bacterium]